jgi:thiol:disulfide interchange protein DsbG
VDQGGTVQVRHRIIGIMGSFSPGKAAAVPSAPDTQAALALREQQHRSGGIEPLAQVPATISSQIEANEALMQQLEYLPTPATLCNHADGNFQSAMGAPSVDKLKQLVGPL